VDIVGGLVGLLLGGLVIGVRWLAGQLRTGRA